MSAPEDCGCDQCAGIAVVTYQADAPCRPAPHCGRCHRLIPRRLIVDRPTEPVFESHRRRATT